MKVDRISSITLHNNQNKKNNNINFQGYSTRLVEDPIVRNLLIPARESFENSSTLSKYWKMIKNKVRPGGVLDANGNPIKNSFRADVNNFSGKIYLYRLDRNGIPETITQELYKNGVLKRANTLDIVTGEELHTFYGKKLDNGNRIVTTIRRESETGRFEGASCKNIDLHNFTVWEKDENGMFTYHDKKNGWLRMTPDKGLQGYLKSDDAIYGFKHIGYPNGYIECRKSDLSANLIGIFHMPRITGSIEAVLEMFKSGKLQEIMSKNFKQ